MIERLKQLVAVHEEGTLSGAAAKLLISQPALTRSMQKLESELEVELFIRKKNKLELTETGEHAVEKAHILLEQIEQFKIETHDFYTRQMKLTGGVCAPGVNYELEERLGNEVYRQQVTIEQQPHHQLEDGLLNRHYDFVITDRPIQHPDVIAQSYFKEALYLSLPLDHPLTSKQVVTLDDFVGLTMLLRTKLGVWESFIGQLADTQFIIQDNDAVFNQLANASDLPVFTTNITQDYGISDFYRRHIPIEAPHAVVTFYLNYMTDQQNKVLPLLVESQDTSTSH